MNNGEERIGLYKWDAQIRSQAGIEHLAGVDEAGAGPLAGRVYAAAVILPQGVELPYLNDSKKVTPRRRELLEENERECDALRQKARTRLDEAAQRIVRRVVSD